MTSRYWYLWLIILLAIAASAPRPAQDSRPAAPSRQEDDGGIPAVAGLPELAEAPTAPRGSSVAERRIDNGSAGSVDPWVAGSSPARRTVGVSSIPAVPPVGIPSASPRSVPASEVAAGTLEPTASMGGTIAGWATWFASPQNVSAAGPALRRALGPGWRGTHVRVCSGGRCVVTVLGDWCACGPRGGTPTVIDLDDDAFARLAPLSRGTLVVSIRTIPAPPPTSTAP